MPNQMTAFDAILGCLYGQAIGDAMGMPSELWPLEQVRQHFGWIDRFLPGPQENKAAVGFIAGEYTDDTQQAVALLEALIESEGQVNPLLIARNIIKWAEQVKAFEKNILGPTSKASLLAICQGVPIADIEANGVTNGAAMRVAPLGCLLTTDDVDRFIQQVRVACSPTHKSDIAVAGAVAIAWSISRAIEGASWEVIKHELPDIARRAQKQQVTTFSPCLSKRIGWAFSLTADISSQPAEQIIDVLYQNIGAGMDTIESVPMALALVDVVKGDPLACALLAANVGGDTDTIGAMATAICGALQGITVFPQSWIATINQANHIDFQPYAVALHQLRLKG